MTAAFPTANQSKNNRCRREGGAPSLPNQHQRQAHWLPLRVSPQLQGTMGTEASMPTLVRAGSVWVSSGSRQVDSRQLLMLMTMPRCGLGRREQRGAHENRLTGTLKSTAIHCIKPSQNTLVIAEHGTKVRVHRNCLSGRSRSAEGSS